MAQQLINFGNAPDGAGGDNRRLALEKLQSNDAELYAAIAAAQAGLLYSRSFKNGFINGNFDFWQRGLSFSAIGNYYTADRWIWQTVATTGQQLTAQNWGAGDANNPGYGANYLQVVQTGNTDAVNHVNIIGQRIESVRRYSGKTVTIQFTAYTDVAKPIAVEMRQSFGSGGSATVSSIGAQIVNLAAGWGKYSIAVNVPSIAGKTIGAGDWIGVFIWMSSGTAFSGSIAGLGAHTGTWAFAGFDIAEGATSLPVEFRPPQVELALCQRYYEKSYDIAVAPGTAATGGCESLVVSNLGSGTPIGGKNASLKVTKRSVPTITAFSPGSGASGKIRDFTSNADANANVANVGVNSFAWYAATTSTTTTVNLGLQWVADAEL